MNYYSSIKNKKINTLLSIFTISALILAPLGISGSAFSQSSPFIMIASNSANQGISQAQSIHKIHYVYPELSLVQLAITQTLKAKQIAGTIPQVNQLQADKALLVELTLQIRE